MKPLFFKSAADLRRWFEKNHDSADEVWLGYYKKGSGKQSVTYKEAVDEALCFGWIDTKAKGIDAASYMQRYTPRRPKSIWSVINTRRIRELIAEGRVTPVGLKTFEQRDPKRAKLYSFENDETPLSPALKKTFRAHSKAWTHFEEQPPGYRRVSQFWVMSAKKEETRIKRLQELIECSAQGVKIKMLRRKTDAQPAAGRT